MLLGTLRRRGGRAALWLIVGLLVGGTAGALGGYFLKRGKSGIPGGPRLGAAEEMSLVPGDAAGFIHIRARDVWHTEGFAELRKIVEKAGPQAAQVLDDDFVPAPSSLDRLTLVFVKAPREPEPFPGPPKGMPKGPGKGPNQPRKNAQPPKGGFPPPPPPQVGLPGGFPGADLPSLGTDLKVVLVLAFNKAFDADKVRDTYLKGGVKKTIGTREYCDDPGADFAAYFLDDKVMVLGDSAGMKLYLTRLAAPAGPLSSAIELTREGGRHIVASLNVVQFGVNAKMFEDGPGELRTVTKELSAILKAESLTVGVALGEETRIDIRAHYKNEEEAAASEAALRAVAKIGREKLADPKKQMEATLNGKPGHPKPRPIKDLPMAVAGLFGLGSLDALDEWLADPPLTRAGSEVVLTPKVPSLTSLYAGAVAASVGMLLPAVEKVRDTLPRTGSQNNLRQIALAMHSFALANNDRFPMPAFMTVDGQAKPGGLSWRVHLLPYLEEAALYKEFRLDEPWDSEHNRPLADRVPRVYVSPSAPPTPGKTYYKVCTGPNALFRTPAQFGPGNIPDGSSNTIMVIEGGPAVTWTKPDDVVVDEAKPLPDMKFNGNPRINVALADGSVRTIDLSTIKEKTLRNAIDPADGQVLGKDW